MQIWKKISQTVIVSGIAGLLLATASQANANPTASGSLAVTATVASSIQLTFGSDANGVTLTGVGTNSATLGFGTLTQYGTPPSHVTINLTPSATLCSTCFAASTPVLIVVNAADSSSSAFTLTATVSTPTNGEKLAVGTSAALSSTATQITTTGTYGSAGNEFPVYLGIPNTTADNTSLTDTISFIATAN